jgi:hypothetical protein
MADHTCHFSNVGVGILETHIVNRPRLGSFHRLLPKYHAAVDNQFMPNSSKTEMDDVGGRAKVAPMTKASQINASHCRPANSGGQPTIFMTHLVFSLIVDLTRAISI